MKNSLYLVLALSTTLIACSSTPQEEHAQVEAEVAQEKLAKQVEHVEIVLDNVPDWYIQQPKSDALGFYAAGTGVSSTLDMALTKAKLNASFELTKKYRQIVSGNERSYTAETTNSGSDDSIVVSSTEKVIDSLVANADLSNYDIVDKKAYREGAKFRIYVLTYKRYDSDLDGQDELIREIKTEAKEAYKELERRVDKVSQKHQQNEDTEQAVEKVILDDTISTEVVQQVTENLKG